MTIRRFSRGFRPARVYPLILLSVITLAGCVSITDPWVSELPEVSSENSVTLSGRSIVNVSDIVHEHVLKVDGLLAARFKNGQVKTFSIPAGPHQLTLDCHTSVVRGRSSDHPFNYNVSDGKAKMNIDVNAGDEVCLKITYSLTNCAVLQDADPSYCRPRQ